MDVGDVATWFAAGVAIIAMSSANSAKTQARAALKQADEAQKARKAAEGQVAAAEAAVVEARRSAEAAEAQAGAALEQLAILRGQVEDQRAEKDKPQFEIIPPPSTGESTVPIEIMMVAGTDLQTIEITVTGKDVLGVAGDPASQIRGSQKIVRYEFAVGSQTSVWVDFRDVLDTAISVQIDCEALDGRTWSLLPRTIRLTHPAVRDFQH